MNAITIAQVLAYVVFYAITGFGPGFLLGIAIANSIGAYRKSSISANYAQNIKDAATHNAQWHPTHKKWHDQE